LKGSILAKLPYHVIHYAGTSPESSVGGVESFARGLEDIFGQVIHMTPATLDLSKVRAKGIPVICDNQFVLDWPEDIPVIGFQHGVAAEKFRATRKLSHWRMARQQRRAARRRNVLWVACSQWIGRAFGEMHGNAARHVIHHPIDVNRFDGIRPARRKGLVLHDARLPHKGSRLVPKLAAAVPELTFEALDCPPEAVPDRLREAEMFLHLSRYEGNSIMCLEAMAMDLPCLFTRVGLMRDSDRPEQVETIDADTAFGNPAGLIERFGDFARSVSKRELHPRQWVLGHATPEIARAKWAVVMEEFAALSGASGHKAAQG
jgi:glycosyltransferase involved in cell wall biosynthesis